MGLVGEGEKENKFKNSYVLWRKAGTRVLREGLSVLRALQAGETARARPRGRSAWASREQPWWAVRCSWRGAGDQTGTDSDGNPLDAGGPDPAWLQGSLCREGGPGWEAAAAEDGHPPVGVRGLYTLCFQLEHQATWRVRVLSRVGGRRGGFRVQVEESEMSIKYTFHKGKN